MKIIVITIGVLIGTFIVGQGVAQTQEKETKKQIGSLEFMVGEWSGGGWMMTQETGRVEFTQKEQINLALNGAVLEIAGQGWNLEGEMIHNAKAIVSYDHQAKEFFMHSFLENGRQTKANFELTSEGKIKWWFKPYPEQPAVIEYFITVDNDTWTENGRYSPDGKQWFPFIEFTLKRKS